MDLTGNQTIIQALWRDILICQLTYETLVGGSGPFFHFAFYGIKSDKYEKCCNNSNLLMYHTTGK